MTLAFADASLALAEYLEAQAEQTRALAAKLRESSSAAQFRTYTPEHACALLNVRAQGRAARHAALRRESKGKGWYRKIRRGVWIVDATVFDRDLGSRGT